MGCRFCNHSLESVFIDLGHTPPSNSFFTLEELSGPEITYPLKAMLCDNCFLVQVEEQKNHEQIFNKDYVYLSSMSKEWLKHAKKYAYMTKERFGLDAKSQVIEVASNDGYLLDYFKEQGMNCLGIEPASSAAAIAKQKEIETLEEFFCSGLAKKLKEEHREADLLVGNNVLAHVPDLNDFVIGLKIALKERGVLTMEFPSLVNLIKDVQFDTIYHEHFSYFSFSTVRRIFKHHGLELFDVDELETHGGSLRIYARHERDDSKPISERVPVLLEKENKYGINNSEHYKGFSLRAEKVKRNFLRFLIDEKENGRKVIAYGAAAKGNTLLNYCGVKPDLISEAIDTTPFKQGKYLPGSHIPVYSESKLEELNPDTIVILPWNHKKEIREKLEKMSKPGTKFVTVIPEMEIVTKS